MGEIEDQLERRRQLLEEAGVKRRSYGDYARRLFHNVYNYTLLGGAATAAAMTGDWWIFVAGLGLEALWMLYAPDSKAMRRRVDAEMDREEAMKAEERRFEQLQRMQEYYRGRCRALMLKQAEITKLAMENRTLHSDLLAGEISKLQKLTDSFIDLCVTLGRYTAYLDKEDVGEVERLQRQYEKQIADGKGPTDLAKKNLDVVMRRIERLREITEFVERAKRQLELIENSFALLSDQIVSMRSPQELSGQLDELIDGVNAVRETAREADQLLVGVSS
ncbi:MAG: hypothetical protein IT381_09430 [Deltaproteobacteria bacterium]|nr:hypothetical protein [Deltaproteobacteria bacterium]